MSNTDAYNRFLTNLCEGNEGELRVMLNNNLINQCVQKGFRNGMTEAETLRVAILAMIKVSDKDLECKLKAVMMSAAPSFNRGE